MAPSLPAPMTFSLYGPDAILIQHEDSLEKSQLLRRALESAPPEGMLEFTPGFASVLLEFAGPVRSRFDEIRHHIEFYLATQKPEEVSPRPLREIPVLYDGKDLATLSDQLGLSVDKIIEIHSKPTYTVRILGFAPGFPYLAGLDSRLHVPRLVTPRPRVPAGSVAIGGTHAGIYPLAGPGGWHLLGTTTAKLFRPTLAESAETAANSFLLQPGDSVKFIPIHA